MTTAAVNYAKVLYGMPVSITTVQETENLFSGEPGAYTVPGKSAGIV